MTKKLILLLCVGVLRSSICYSAAGNEEAIDSHEWRCWKVLKAAYDRKASPLNDFTHVTTSQARDMVRKFSAELESSIPVEETSRVNMIKAIEQQLNAYKIKYDNATEYFTVPNKTCLVINEAGLKILETPDGYVHKSDFYKIVVFVFQGLISLLKEDTEEPEPII